MTMPRKGSRIIVVEDVRYRWRVLPWKNVKNWRPAKAGLLNEAWVQHAQKFGLGEVADGEFDICIEAEEDPRSQAICTYHALVFYGLLAPEKFTQIKPSLVREIILRSRQQGWKPQEKGNFHLNIVENSPPP